MSLTERNLRLDALVENKSPWTLTHFLTAAVIFSAALGPAVVVPIGNKTLTLLFSHVAVALLLAHIAISSLRGFRFPPGAGASVVFSALLLGVGVLSGPDLAAASFGFFSFLVGVVGGVVTGRLWAASTPSRFGWIELGFVGLLVAGTTELLVSLRATGSGESLHEAAQVSWGASNFVAGVLVVSALVLAGRVWSAEKPWYWYLPSLYGVAGAALTLSRGALVALAVGMIVFLWLSNRGSVGRFMKRFLALIVPLAALIALDAIVQVRLSVNQQVLRNFDNRLDLYAVAFSDFLRSPLSGTGWLGLRESSSELLGTNSAYAHNIVISLLQIAGVCALPFLIILIRRSIPVIVRNPVGQGAAVAAALVFSMSDPFLEGTVGGIVTWCALTVGSATLLKREASLSSTLNGALPVMIRSKSRGKGRPVSHPRVGVR